jgi:hypothetical protein
MAQSLITPQARASYPTLVKPRAVVINGKVQGDPKYGITLIFEQGTDITELRKAAMDVAKEFFGGKLKGLLDAGKFSNPFRTDVEEKGYPAGATFINCTSLQRPGAVHRYKDAAGKPRILTDEEIEKMIYAGANVRASVRPFAYDTAGNRGVSFALNNVQWLGDNERLDGRKAAEDEFDGFEDDAADIEKPEAEVAEAAEAEAPAPAPAAPKAAAKPAKEAPAPLAKDRSAKGTTDLSDVL